MMKKLLLTLALFCATSAHAWTLGQDGTMYAGQVEMPHTTDGMVQLTVKDWAPNLRSDEYPQLYNSEFRFMPGAECTGTVITPYPTATNQVTGQVITLLPSKPDVNGDVWYKAPIAGVAGQYWTITMWVSGHSNYYRAKTSKPGRVPVTYGMFYGKCPGINGRQSLYDPNAVFE